jgi:hypothetical protein
MWNASLGFRQKRTARQAEQFTCSSKTRKRFTPVNLSDAKPAHLQLIIFFLPALKSALKFEVAKEKTDLSSIFVKPFIANPLQKA